MLYPPGSPDSAFLPQAAPVGGGVLTKTCSGIHVGTQIDQVLRNLGVDKVIMAGFYTDQCISTSVRDLADIGYRVSLHRRRDGGDEPCPSRMRCRVSESSTQNSKRTTDFVARVEALSASVGEAGSPADTGDEPAPFPLCASAYVD